MNIFTFIVSMIITAIIFYGDVVTEPKEALLAMALIFIVLTLANIYDELKEIKQQHRL